MTIEERRELYEHWIDLRDFPNHQISTFGRIRNKRNGYILKPFTDRYGYLRLSIGNVDNVYIHRLMCETFYGPPVGDQTQVNHIDCDRTNNHIFNLEWCSPRENVIWAMRKGNLDPMIPLAKATEMNCIPVRIVELDRDFRSIKDCADFLNTNGTRIKNHISNGTPLFGYHIEYVREEN